MAKTEICNLTTLEMLALAQAVRLNDCNDDSILPSESEAHVDFSVRIKGNVKRGKSGTRRGTNRATTAEAMVMLLVISGVTREHSPRKLIEAWHEFGSLDKKAMASRIATLSDDDRNLFEECLALFQTEIVDALPRIPAKGGVKFDGNVTREG